MNTAHKQFLIGLQNANRRSGIKIDKKRLTLETIIQGYNNLVRQQDQVIEGLNEHGALRNAKDSEIVKIRDYELFKYWLDPFNISLRNAIGATDVPETDIEVITKKDNTNVRLTEETIHKIRKQYNLEEPNYKKELKSFLKSRQGKTSHNTGDRSRVGVSQEFLDGEESMQYSSKEELMQIVDELMHRELYEQEKEIEIKTSPIEKIETYDFKTGQGWVQGSQINKYRISFEYDGKLCSKEFFGRIDLLKFYNDKRYQRVVLEAIEDMEMRNHEKGEQNKYIGGIVQYTKQGIIHFQNILDIEDVIAINAIEKEHQKAQEESEKANQKLAR